MKLKEGIQLWLRHGGCDVYSQKTIENYRRSTNKFCKRVCPYAKKVKFNNETYCDQRCKVNAHKIKDYEFVSYYMDLKKEGYAETTMHLFMMSLRELWKYLFIRNIVPVDWRVIPYPKSPQTKRRVTMNGEEVEMLVSQISNKDEILDLRDELILRFLASSGCRVSELVNLNVGELNLTKQLAMIVSAKNKRQRIIFWDSKTQSLLKRYLPLRTKLAKDDALFVSTTGSKCRTSGNRLTTRSVQRLVKKYREKAGITKQITPHTFRHQFGANCVENAVHPRNQMRMMGHKNPESTFNYMRVDTSTTLNEYIKAFDKNRTFSDFVEN